MAFFQLGALRWDPLEELQPTPVLAAFGVLFALALARRCSDRQSEKRLGRGSSAARALHGAPKRHGGASHEQPAPVTVLRTAFPAAGESAPNIQGVVLGQSGEPGAVMHGNGDSPTPFTGETCSGCLLAITKTTSEASNQQFAPHFRGRKRLWELRVRFRFKRKIKSPVIGIELDHYIPLNSATKALMEMTVTALRQVAGKALYHSVGDDPSGGAQGGELEKPVFAMPMWACDQFVVTPEGEDPPDLDDPHFSSFGSVRAENRSDFVRDISALELGPGPTYTFAFWGISQFIDVVNWQITKVIPFRTIGFNSFCGSPPVTVVLYSLEDADDPAEERHLQCRKQYHLRLPLWSSDFPPSEERLREILPKTVVEQGEQVYTGPAHVGCRRARWQRLLACCASPRGLCETSIPPS